MAITKALMYARTSSASSTGTGLYKKARLAATRLNYHGPKLLLKVGGTVRTDNFDRDNWSIQQRGRGQAGTLSIELFGFTPVVASEIILGVGNLSNAPNRLFRGKIVRIRQVRHRLNQGRVIWACQCLDWSYDAGNEKVTKKYTSQTATAIAQDLVSTFAPAGFTSTHVQASLATIDDIQFTMQTLGSALDQLAERIGGTWYWDTDKDLHLFTSETGESPESLTSSNKHTRTFSYESDIEALRNRIIVEGAGAAVQAAMTAGSTTIPVDDAVAFAPSGTNYAKLEAQIILYTGKSTLDGQGSVVAGTPQSPSAPTAANDSDPSGLLSVGAYTYKVTFVVSGKESESSSASNSITISATANPSAPTATVSTSASGNLTAGAEYDWRITFYNSRGETTSSNAGSATPSSISAPGAPLGSAVSNTAGNLLPPAGSSGSWNYRVTFVTGGGETAGGTALAGVSITQVSAPGSAPARGGTTGGSMALGTYYYSVTFVTAAGETTDGPSGSVTLTGSENAVSLTSIPTSGDGRVTKRRIYRTMVGGIPANAFLVTTINDNTSTTYTDTAADASLGSPRPAVNNSGSGQISVTSIPTSADGRVTKRRLYRTEQGGSTYKFVTEIADNSTTSYTDNVADASLGTTAPTSDTSSGAKVDLTNIPTGPTGTTGRKIYRTTSGGSDYYYVGTIGNNSATTFTDNVSDQQILTAAALPTTSTFDGGKISLSSIPVGPAGTTARKLYRTEAGGSLYRALATVGDNVTTTYADNRADSSLGETAPTASAIGAAAGSTTLRVADQSQFSGSGGWLAVGNQLIRHTGRTAASGEGDLTGIPSSGVGALTSTVPAGIDLINAPHLTGIPASGDGTITHTLRVGDAIHVLEIQEDATSQADYGVREEFIQDRRLSRDGCDERGAAVLALVKDPRVTGHMTTTDPKMRVGKALTINVTEWDVSATVTVQSVTIRPGRDAAGIPWPQPMREATFASRSLDDLFSELRAIRERLAR